MMAQLPYYCIHCGSEESQVYKTYAERNLIKIIKLLKCKNCSEVVNSYCEFDPTLVSINIILKNKKAYRHILLNTCFENFWKLGVVFLFCETYSFWCFQKGIEYKTNYADFYELEVNFYRVLLRTALSTIAFDGIVLLLSWMNFKLFRRKPPKCFSLWTLWKGLCLCRYAVLFELVPLIWSYTNAQPTILIVYGIFILSNLQSYEVVTGASRFTAFTILAAASIIRFYLLSLLEVCMSK